MPSPSKPAQTTQGDREFASGAATEALLSLGLKPVVRELHDVDRLEEATRRWQAMGYATEVGEPVREDVDTAAMYVDVEQIHTIRHLATHPLIERLVALGGRPVERALLNPSSRVHRWLAERLDAERTPHQGPRPTGARVRERCAVYVSGEASLAERAKELDRMAESSREGDSAKELGALLGYPPCCVEAFCALPRRWPNRYPIAASMGRTNTFEPRLNNVALDRFAWIAWFPCRYDCEASLTLANAAAEALSQTHVAEMARAEATLALPRLYLDDRRQAVLHGATGTRTALTFERLEPLTRGDQPADPAWAEVAEADALKVDGQTVTLYREGQPIPWQADPLLLPFGLP